MRPKAHCTTTGRLKGEQLLGFAVRRVEYGMDALEGKTRENESYSSNHVMCKPGTADKDGPVSSLQMHRIKTLFLF